MLGQVRVLIAVGAAVGAGCQDERAADPAPGAVTVRGRRDPALDVALPAGATRVEGKNFHVDSAVLPGCTDGAVCTALADLTALGAFKVNREYPFKFVPEAATTLAEAATFSPTGVHTGRLVIRFRRDRAAPLRIAGAFKLSVCSADQCLVETAALALAVP